jgi:hypothetical protein
MELRAWSLVCRRKDQQLAGLIMWASMSPIHPIIVGRGSIVEPAAQPNQL